MEGIRLVEAAMLAGADILELLVQTGYTTDRVEALVRLGTCPVHEITAQQFGLISDVQQSQGVLAVARIPANDVIWNPGLHRRILAFDGVQDPGNVGTLIRTAAWFGIDGVVGGSQTADFYQPKVVRSTMGGLWDVDLARIEDLASWLVEMKAAGYDVCGASMAGTAYQQWQPESPAILVLGAEAHGISEEVLECLDEEIFIPKFGKGKHASVESLNVSAAGAILVENWCNQ